MKKRDKKKEGEEGEWKEGRERRKRRRKGASRFNKILFYSYMVSILNFPYGSGFFHRTKKSEAKKFTNRSRQSGIFLL